jgi:hypothetical protein
VQRLNVAETVGVRHGRNDHPVLLEVLGSSGREVRDVFRAATPTHRRLPDHLVTSAVATLAIDLICATVAFPLERHSQETEITTLGSPCSGQRLSY